jgi:hypothetical protein
LRFIARVSGIVTKALGHGADPFEYALAYYLRPDSYFAHYLVDFRRNDRADRGRS